MLAKALYDNKAECSDELAFRKGDILTVLEQNIFGSEGWWRCYLHGRQGLAPANRLQLFTIPQHDFANSLGRRPSQQGQQNIYQVPSAPKTEAGSMYEKMDNLYNSPGTPKNTSGELYQMPMSLPAQIFYDKANNACNPRVLTLPRASRAASISQAEVYDVPPCQLNVAPGTPSGRTPSPVNMLSPCLLAAEQSQQQIYDIPSSPESPTRSYMKSPKASNVYDVPPTGTLVQKQRSNTPPVVGQYSTLPNPRKSDWIYDVPLSPEKDNLRPNFRKISIDRGMVYDVPPTRYGPVHSKSEDGDSPSLVYNVPLVQKKSLVPGQCLYDIPASLDISPSHHNGSLLKDSSTFRKPKLQQTDSKENVYDIPRGSTIESPSKSEMSSSVYNERIYDIPPPITTNRKPSLHKQDRFSVSSSDSQNSTLSTSSTLSSESTMDDGASEVILDLEVAIKKVTELQEQLSSSIASLMIFVSSKWRLQENMESNLQDIHRAVDRIVFSLRQFIDFAQTIKANSTCLTDLNIQHRIANQLETLSDSYQTLAKNQEAIDGCNWSLQALVINKPHTVPDDLDRFVMVARTIPDDVKRFVSIIIANGKLLFRKAEKVQRLKPAQQPRSSQKPQVPARQEIKVLQEPLVNRAREKPSDKKIQLPKQKAIDDSGYVYLQKKEDFEKMQKLSSMQQLERKTSPEEKRRGWLKPDSQIITEDEVDGKSDPCLSKELPTPSFKLEPVQKPMPVKKLALSEPCYLYFGALHKAIQVFNNSLCKNETPEVFIGQGKLIIMVGQKLVDMLCQDVKSNEARNDVLYKSSELCSLLKNLALATKTAAIQYPNMAAMRELQRSTDKLSNHTQIFRSMLE